MGYPRKGGDVRNCKYIRYKEGAERYSLGLNKFMEMAREAGAVYKIDKVALVNTEVFEQYLETFRLP